MDKVRACGSLVPLSFFSKRVSAETSVQKSRALFAQTFVSRGKSQSSLASAVSALSKRCVCAYHVFMTVRSMCCCVCDGTQQGKCRFISLCKRFRCPHTSVPTLEEGVPERKYAPLLRYITRYPRNVATANVGVWLARFSGKRLTSQSRTHTHLASHLASHLAICTLFQCAVCK